MSDFLWPHGLCSPWNSPGQNTGVGSLSLLQGIFPTQGSNPGLPHCRRILYQLSHQGSQRILEWVVYPFSSRSSRPRNWTGVSCTAGRFFTNWAIREAQSHSVVSNFLRPHGLYSPWTSPGQNTRVHSLSLLQGIFPTEGSSPDLPHCRRILNQLSHQGSPRILEWVVYPFSSGPSRPRNQTGSPAWQVDSLSAELLGKLLGRG